MRTGALDPVPGGRAGAPVGRRGDDRLEHGADPDPGFPAQRGKAVGIQATTVYLGLATGAPLGGWLTDTLGWRSVFYVNIPFGLTALLLGMRLLRNDPSSARRERFDLVGAGVYVLGLVALLLALNRGHHWGWTSPLVVGCVAGGVVVLALWAVIELRVPSPMLDLRCSSDGRSRRRS